jgi:small-conductance mechanosensitive channel
LWYTGFTRLALVTPVRASAELNQGGWYGCCAGAIVRSGVPRSLDGTWVHALEGYLFVGYVLLYRLVGEILARCAKNLTVEDTIDTQLVVFLRRVIQLVLLSIALIKIFAHCGPDISALVATLGVSSLTFALAARAFLEETIAGCLIIVDRPFSVGDRIQLPQAVMGEYGDWGMWRR